MRVKMQRRITVQDAGRVRPLDADSVVELADGIGESLIEAGWAVRVEDVVAVPGAAENRAVHVQATRRRPA